MNFDLFGFTVKVTARECIIEATVQWQFFAAHNFVRRLQSAVWAVSWLP